MTWTRIENWEQLSNNKEGFQLEHPVKCVVMVMWARVSQSESDKDTTLYSARIYIISKKIPLDDEPDIYHITLATSHSDNNFKLKVLQHLGLDSQANSKMKYLFADTYPKSVYSNRLSSPQKFIEFVITEIYDRTKVDNFNNN